MTFRFTCDQSSPSTMPITPTRWYCKSGSCEEVSAQLPLRMILRAEIEH